MYLFLVCNKETDSERESGLPKVTSLVSGRARIQKSYMPF